MYALRDMKTKRALNVSYSEEGLMWSTNATGKLIYFENAHLQRVYDKEGNITNVRIGGNLNLNPNVYVEKFVPSNQPTTKGQITEYTWTSKAYRLLYHTS
jgi:hypothetical protein